MSFNSNTTGVTCEAGCANPSGAPEFIPGFSGFHVAQSLFFCVMFYQSLFGLLSFSFGHCVFYPSLIYGFSLPLFVSSNCFTLMKGTALLLALCHPYSYDL